MPRGGNVAEATSKTSEKLPRVVLVVPDEEWVKVLSDAVHRAGFLPHRAPSAETATLAVTYREPAAVIVDAGTLRATGFTFVDMLRASAPNAPFFVIADAEETDLRLKALMWGVQDCLVRPIAPQEVVLKIRRALDANHKRQDLVSKRDEADARAGRDHGDMLALREQERRQAVLMQRAIEFHQRLEPKGDGVGLPLQFLRHLSVQIGVDRLAFLTPSHPGGSWLAAHVSWGVPRRLADQLRLPAAGELTSLLKASGVPVVLDRVAGFPHLRVELGLLATGGFKACVPVLHQGDLLGVILLGESRGGGVPDDDAMRLAHFLTASLAPALAAEGTWMQERRLAIETMHRLVAVMESSHPYLAGHAARVARWSAAIGRQLGMGTHELSHLSLAALLHDLGRYGPESDCGLEAGPMGDAAWAAMRQHPEESARLLDDASWPEPVLLAVRHHHERWDGQGYPAGLAGQSIPWYARILGVADALDALLSARPHRAALSLEAALAQVQADAGARFDPIVVQAALRSATVDPPVESDVTARPPLVV
jgi:HD-GYP domain-containing protein (c-di-GMP phosphodiesterase class II)/CheY-like chemotaxis protein